MPKNSIDDWDTTESNNTDIGGTNIAEGCAPGNLNDAVRKVMAQLKTFYNTLGTLAFTGSTSQLVAVGTVAHFRRTTAPDGWVIEDGGTIGNVSSGATTRADDDTEALFTLLWGQFSNSVLAIQDSSGAASTRGASAAADFAANKRLPLFDSRTRFLRGSDNSLGFDTGLTVGASQSDVLKSHLHAVDPPSTSTSSDSHSHYVAIGNPGDYDYGTNLNTGQASPVATVGRTERANTSSDSHNHTVNIGSFNSGSTGDSLETRPRSSVALICIKL